MGVVTDASPLTPAQIARFARELAPLGPGTLDVMMDVTNSCNLTCRMCYFSYPEVFGRPREQMSPEVFARVAQQTFPYARMVMLSAGCEPLVHDDFPALLEIAAGYRVPHLKYLTNGQLLDEELALASIRCGVTEVHVSIDGATTETYEWVRRGGRFDKLVANLERLDALKRQLGSATPVVQFNITLMRRNVHELPEFARLARRLGVRQLSCRHLLPYEGLDIESECLVHDRAGANAALEAGLAAAAEQGLDVVNYPDSFELGPREGSPWTSLDRAASVAQHVGFEVRHATSFAGPGRVRTGTPGPGAAVAAPAEATSSGAGPSAASSPGTGATSRGASAPGADRSSTSATTVRPTTPPRPAATSATAPAAALPARLGWWPRRLPWSPGPPTDASAVPEHPFGRVDTPEQSRPRRGQALVLAGWALHRAGVARVLVCERRGTSRGSATTTTTTTTTTAADPARDWPGPLNARALVPLVEARWIVGGRPDVAARFASLPDAARSAWSARVDLADLSPDAEHDLFVVAEGRDGRRAVIGRRLLHVDQATPDPGLLYCAKPFRALYLDAGTNLYPYPDCQTVEPFARLVDEPSFEALWYGEAFDTLRRRILALDPPSMCRGCPDFVNRNPDDPDYYVPRQLGQTFRLPLGALESPRHGEQLAAAGITLRGWAAGASPVVAVRILREALPADPAGLVDADGLVAWTDAWLGEPREDVGRSHGRLLGAAHSGWSTSLLGLGLDPDTTRLALRVQAHNAEGARVELARLELRRTAAEHWTVVDAQAAPTAEAGRATSATQPAR